MASQIAGNSTSSFVVFSGKKTSRLRFTVPLWRESTCDRWVKGQTVTQKMFSCHAMPLMAMIGAFIWQIYEFITSKSVVCYTWWRHQMETFSALLALCAGNSPVPVNSSRKGQWRRALMVSLICARINDLVNNHQAGDLWRHRGHYDVSVMTKWGLPRFCSFIYPSGPVLCFKTVHIYPPGTQLLRNSHVKIHVSLQRFSNLASDWFVAHVQPPANHKPC